MTIQNFFASNDIPWADDPASQRTDDGDDMDPIPRDNYAHDCDAEGLAVCGWCSEVISADHHLGRIYGALFAHCGDDCRGLHEGQHEADLAEVEIKRQEQLAADAASTAAWR